MDSLRLFPIFEDKFVYVSHVSRIFLPSMIIPILVLISIALDKITQLINNNIVSPPEIFIFLLSISCIVYTYPIVIKTIKSETQTKKNKKITPRFSQRLFEKRQKAGTL